MLVVGDSFITVEDFRNAFATISGTNEVRFIRLDEGEKLVPVSGSEKSLGEYLGSTRQLISELGDAEVLAVHGAPVSDEVLGAGKNLRLLCCARGGPVNIDIAAASRRHIPVVTAPGKNAEAVAELTVALMVMLSRNLIRAYNHVVATRVVGKDNYEGNQFFGHELDGKVLGLIGFGRVGSRVARRALGFGMSVLVYDPYVDRSKVESDGVSVASLDEVLSRSDFVSLHARESKENENLMGERQFAIMKQGAFFVNTSRPSMVDEAALHASLKSGRLAGAGLDVVRYDPARPINPLVELDSTIVMPHLGGATFETTTKGAVIVAKQVERYLRGERLETVVNPEALK
ncbi:MAG: NAD(P)-binding domain-containing protein [Thaumarchaeota archaeon]|nr:NAD(P)-binding domain-containing protein [Nitrososphaerota archaeon]